MFYLDGLVRVEAPSISCQVLTGEMGQEALGTRMNSFLSKFGLAYNIFRKKITIHTTFLPVLQHFHDFFNQIFDQTDRR